MAKTQRYHGVSRFSTHAEHTGSSRGYNPARFDDLPPRQMSIAFSDEIGPIPQLNKSVRDVMDQRCLSLQQLDVQLRVVKNREGWHVRYADCMGIKQEERAFWDIEWKERRSSGQ